MKRSSLLLYVALGVGAYLLFKNSSSAASAGPTPTGIIRLTDGTLIQASQVAQAGGFSSAGQFTWNGQSYTLSSLGPDGVYDTM